MSRKQRSKTQAGAEPVIQFKLDKRHILTMCLQNQLYIPEIKSELKDNKIKIRIK